MVGSRMAVVVLGVVAASIGCDPGFGFRGRVRLPDGRGVADATVFLISLDQSAVRQRVQTAADGQVNVGGIGEGRFALLVVKAGFASVFEQFEGMVRHDIVLVPCDDHGAFLDEECAQADASARRPRPPPALPSGGGALT